MNAGTKTDVNYLDPNGHEKTITIITKIGFFYRNVIARDNFFILIQGSVGE